MAAAAGLTAMAARYSDDLGDRPAVAEESDRLRVEVADLAERDGDVYAQVLDAERLPRSDGTREERLRAALEAATEVPLAVVRAAHRVGQLAARLVEEGNPRLRGDAATAVILAEAAAHGAAYLVRLNVQHGHLDAAPVGEADALRRELHDAVHALPLRE